MPKLKLGFSRKVGEDNYGSCEASVNLEIEGESEFVCEPDELQAKIDNLLDLAKSTVDAQFNGDGQSEPALSNHPGALRGGADSRW